MFTVTADPTVAFVDAVRARLIGDSTLMALVTGVYGHVSEAARVTLPYLVLGQRSNSAMDGAGSMGLAWHRLTLQIDGWAGVASDGSKGPAVISAIGSRVFHLLERTPLIVPGFRVVTGSLTREMQDVYDEPDEDKPNARLYRLVQRWTAELHEAA